MGFGLLFSGILTLLGFKIFPVGLLGTALMFSGTSKLCSHAPYFKKAKIASGIFFIYFAVFSAVWTCNICGLLDGFGKTGVKWLWAADELIYSAVLFAFSYTLIKAFREICSQVGYEKGVNKYRLCSALLNVFGIGAVLRFALNFTTLGNAMRAPLVLLELVLIISLALWSYCCYMMIATQEIIDDEKAKIAKYDAIHNKKLK